MALTMPVPHGYVSRVLWEVNEHRRQLDLPLLEQSEALMRSAQAKADDMVRREYYAHTAPDGTQPWDLALEHGYGSPYMTENILYTFTSDPRHAYELWRDSQPHREAMEYGPPYIHFGMGATRRWEDRSVIYAVLHIGAPEG